MPLVTAQLPSPLFPSIEGLDRFLVPAGVHMQVTLACALCYLFILTWILPHLGLVRCCLNVA